MLGTLCTPVHCALQMHVGYIMHAGTVCAADRGVARHTYQFTTMSVLVVLFYHWYACRSICLTPLRYFLASATYTDGVLCFFGCF